MTCLWVFCLSVRWGIYDFSFPCSEHHPHIIMPEMPLLTLISAFIRYLVILTGKMLLPRLLVKCGKGNIPHHNCFSSLIVVKDSSPCTLWVYTSIWFHYVDNIQGEAVAHDNGSANFNTSLRLSISPSFCICKSVSEINPWLCIIFPTDVKVAQ